MFWGLINIPMWGYYDAYTSAQIELMAADSPITVYNDKGNDKKCQDDVPYADSEDVTDKAKRWKEKYGDKSSKVTINLKGFGLKMK